jgi:hypothetical protein
MLKVFLLIVVGLAGDPEHLKTFQKWGGTLAEASVRLGVPPERLVYLVDKPGEDIKGMTGAPTREEIAKAFERFAKQAGPEDLIFVTLIGHGSFTGGTAKFNLPGPDMSAADFNAMLQKLPTKQVIFVNTSSSSGPFVEALSGPGRTVVTATRNGAEQYVTLFGGFFVDALTSDAADADKNKRVSVLEAFNYAKAETARAYESKGLLSTEHALLDDNGDKEGSQTPGVAGKDGKISPDGRVANILSFGASGAGLPSDPKLRALYIERQAYERELENLRLMKESMPAEKYQAELERVATALALKAREIRALEGQKP